MYSYTWRIKNNKIIKESTKLKNEIANIRQITNSIIDTQNSGHYKKDYTDFIILDNIYQKAVTNRDIEMFIIFSNPLPKKAYSLAEALYLPWNDIWLAFCIILRLL